MKISIIIPFYNLEAYVGETLSCVREAAVRLLRDARFSQWSVEVICVDDGSKDRTGELLDQWKPEMCDRFPGIEMTVIHQANGGQGPARNTGIAAMHGDYVMFFDGDDLLTADAFVMGAEQICRHANADILAFQYVRFYDGTAFVAPKVDHRESVYDTTNEIPGAVVARLTLWASFYKRATIAGILFKNFAIGQDRLFVAECVARAGEIVVASDVTNGYRRRAASVTHKPHSVVKISALNDHTFEILDVLHKSGKTLDRDGAAVLGSVLLVNVPDRIRRLSKQSEIAEMIKHWKDTLERLPSYPVRTSQKMVCRIYLFLTPCPRLVGLFARMLKKVKHVLWGERPAWRFEIEHYVKTV